MEYHYGFRNEYSELFLKHGLLGALMRGWEKHGEVKGIPVYDVQKEILFVLNNMIASQSPSLVIAVINNPYIMF